MTESAPQPPTGTRAEALLQGVADTMVAPSSQSPAGCVLGIDIAGTRTVVAAGSASPELPAPMHRSTVFDLASVSKVVGTTSCLHRLASMRLVDVDSPVRRIIGTYGGADTTTVRDLLRHRGGLWEWQPLYLAPGGQTNPFDVIDALPLRYAPRRERHYSDLGFMTLGRVVEVLTGATLATSVRELVTEPLGVESLSYGPILDTSIATSAVDDQIERCMIAAGEPYPVLWDDDGFNWRTDPIRGMVNDGNCAHAFGGVAGHAGLFATIDALLDVGAALSTADDVPSLWDPAVTADFFAAGPDAHQALGWRRDELPIGGTTKPLLWHPGFTGTALGFVPGAHIAVAFASNRLLAERPQPTPALWQPVLAALTELLRPKE
ncbi:MAG: serine hydrolase domain-containing protein [Arachnia sp.]